MLPPEDNNILGEYAAISSDVKPDIWWATDALQQGPDAVNVWIGNERSVSALHKDNYENLYCQVIGQKDFVLISPFEALCVQERTLPAATYAPLTDLTGFAIVPDDPPSSVPFWPTVDPDVPMDDKSNPWWKYCKPLRVTLNPGDVLYLPAMWYGSSV